MGTPGAAMGGTGPSVLEDPTGRRARWLRRAGRVVFLVFLGWLLAIVLGGLGLIPLPGIPLMHIVRPSPGPAPLGHLPSPRQPTASDLRPALSSAQFAAARAARAGLKASTAHARARGHRAAAPGVTHGHSAVAPGKTKTTSSVGSRGHSTTAPGRTKTTTTIKTTPSGHGRSTTAPGRTTTRPTGKP